MKEEYPRFLKPNFKPFNPAALASWTEDTVCKDSMRKYTDFYCVEV